MGRWDELEQLENDLATSKGQLSELTHFRKVVLAEETLKALEAGSKSVAAADLVARNSKEYRQAVLALAKIIEYESGLWFKYRRVSREAGL
ncbi:MAG: hypothetical protein GQ474_07935 [Sulfurimonas sp.]|nr:hypothetical protein [Sulfurimonas sp.]